MSRPSFAVCSRRTARALIVMPFSRSRSIESRTWLVIWRGSIACVSSSRRSASVDLPWSMWAMIEKLRRRSCGMRASSSGAMRQASAGHRECDAFRGSHRATGRTSGSLRASASTWPASNAAIVPSRCSRSSGGHFAAGLLDPCLSESVRIVAARSSSAEGRRGHAATLFADPRAAIGHRPADETSPSDSIASASASSRLPELTLDHAEIGALDRDDGLVSRRPAKRQASGHHVARRPRARRPSGSATPRTCIALERPSRRRCPR